MYNSNWFIPFPASVLSRMKIQLNIRLTHLLTVLLYHGKLEVESSWLGQFYDKIVKEITRRQLKLLEYWHRSFGNNARNVFNPRIGVGELFKTVKIKSNFKPNQINLIWFRIWGRKFDLDLIQFFWKWRKIWFDLIWYLV